MSTTSTSSTHHLQPTRQARRLFMSRLATTHHAAPRQGPEGGSRRRATAFTPMARHPLSIDSSHLLSETQEF